MVYNVQIRGHVNTRDNELVLKPTTISETVTVESDGCAQTVDHHSGLH